MPDWSSQTQITRNSVSFAYLQHTLLGLYIWEWLTSLDFDVAHFSGKRPFRWPLIFYFLNRYCLLFSMIGIAIALNVTSEIDCQSLYMFNAVVGNATIGLASVNLSLRTIAVWSRSIYIVVPLIFILAGQWSLLLHGVLLHADWSPEWGQCMITGTDNRIIAASFLYTTVLDFLVLFLTAWKLVIGAPQHSGLGPSRLSDLIFKDGLVYFGIAFIANVTASIFMLLNLNPVMSIIANVPSATASTIVACRVVRRLSDYKMDGPETLNGSARASSLAFKSNNTTAVFGVPRTAIHSIYASNNGGVHVQMETFESPETRYESMSNMGEKEKQEYSTDPEAQKVQLSK